MLEEGSGILGGDAVERGSKCLFQSLDGACGDPAQVGFHLGPAGFDRAQVGAVAGQIAIGKAVIAHPPPGSIETMFIKGLGIQAGSEPILPILERSAWGGIRGRMLK